MERKHNKSLVDNARQLRKTMTKEERHLWYDFLRNYPVRFQRQKVLGRYIVDFYCAAAKLVVELDGSQHFEEAGLARDLQRTDYLEQYGLQVLHIANNDVMGNFPGVCRYIDLCVKQRLTQSDDPPSHLHPRPQA